MFREWALSLLVALAVGGCSSLPNDPINPPPLAEIDAGTRPIFAVAWSPDGTWIAVGTEAGTVSLFRVDRISNGISGRGLIALTHAPPLTLGRITDLAFSPGGTELMAVSLDGQWRVWRVADGSFTSRHGKARCPLLACAFGDDGQPLLAPPGAWACGKAEGAVLVVKPKGIWLPGEVISPPKGDVFTSGTVGRTAVVCGTQKGQIVIVWRSGQRLTFPCLPHRISAVALSPDERRIALGGLDGLIQIRDVSSGALLEKIPFQTGWVTDIAWSPNGSMIVVAGHDITHSPGKHRVRIYAVD